MTQTVYYSNNVYMWYIDSSDALLSTSWLSRGHPILNVR